jgi:hypothetical protein
MNDFPSKSLPTIVLTAESGRQYVVIERGCHAEKRFPEKQRSGIRGTGFKPVVFP